MKKNIAEICLAHGLGGLELSAVNCFEYFKNIAQCHIVVAPGTKLDDFIEHKEKAAIKRSKFFPFIPALKLARFIDKYDIDVVHFHWGKDIMTVVLAKLFSKKKPKILHSRHMNMTRFKDDFYHRWLYKNIDLLHAVTKQIEEQMQRFIPQEVRPSIKTIYLGAKKSQVDMQKVEDLRAKYKLKDTFVVGIVGRICEDKGQYIVIEALAKLKEPNIKALIVGHTMSEAYLSELKKRVKHLGLEERVLFSGFTKDVNEHISLCDVTVLASQKETFGLVVIESMINRVCSLATDRGGPLEIIQDGVDGLLFDRTAENLAQKIAYLYKNPDAKKSLAEAGYVRAKKDFGYDVQMQKLYETIKSL
ncbi:MAG: glycosyltransferase family 4 protein [Sulfurimonas sp.]|uniref:glycosyltransferase family 4 protein n=1 Tax=Sulfurimonas sp. TaxID=2022749 RepID=UPI00262EDC99|nr:glycosyltransferase family 4 protein [Sulfurimonas sp.]MDD2653089.1 glycosyltransferase family 4 protein [Sulfurimonas sp.]MDD3452488.1 glycosyltransferase family 4 protein [Sulfurimonas sp.]